MTPQALIKDALQRIMIAMREGLFVRKDLELLQKWFTAAADIARKKLDAVKVVPGENPKE